MSPNAEPSNARRKCCQSGWRSCCCKQVAPADRPSAGRLNAASGRASTRLRRIGYMQDETAWGFSALFSVVTSRQRRRRPPHTRRMPVAFRSRAADPISASPAGETGCAPGVSGRRGARLSRPEQGLAISRAIRLSAAPTERGIMPASMETADGPVGASGHSSPELDSSIPDTATPPRPGTAHLRRC